MKAKFIFSVIIVVLCLGKANSQIILPAQKVLLQERDKEILNKHLKEYIPFRIDKRELIDNLYKNGECRFRIHIDEKNDWTLDMEFNDMRDPDFKQTYITDEGTFENKSFNLNIFKGFTSDNQVARFTIDENTFFGVILGNQEHYVIRPAKDYTKNNDDESLILYLSSDIIKKTKVIDYINDYLENPDENINDLIMQDDMMEITTRASTPCIYYLKIATDADYQFYCANGQNIQNTYNKIFSTLNIVEGVYESTFKMKFVLTYQNVWTTSSGHPYTSTDASILLGQFQNHWNAYFPYSNFQRNIAHLFTGKNLDSTDIGYGSIGSINDASAYALSTDYEINSVVAHEIGHNLGARHVTNTTTCLCYSSQNSIMCDVQYGTFNLWFCQTSITQINAFISPRQSLLVGDQYLNLSGTVTGFREYKAKNTITSNQVINSGITSYVAGTNITFSNGFGVNAGAILKVEIKNVSDCQY